MHILNPAIVNVCHKQKIFYKKSSKQLHWCLQCAMYPADGIYRLSLVLDT